jgi:vacuolar-type H+-ATPase subunit I/STV1
MFGIATVAAATALALAAVLKNLRLEEVEFFNDFFSLIIISLSLLFILVN